MRRITALSAGVVIWLVGLASPGYPWRSYGWALDTPNERVTLAGLTGVHVVVHEVGPEAEREGLSRSSLQADVEQRLRRAGLRVFTPTEAMASVGRPTLELRVNLLRSPEPPQGYIYSVDLSLRQQIRLVRDRTVESYAVTWSENREVGGVRATRVSVVREAVRSRVDQFVAAWQAVNPDR